MSPVNSEEEAGVGRGCTAGGVNGNLDIGNVINLVGIRDVVAGIGERLIRNGAVRKIDRRAVHPGEEARDMKDRVDAREGGRETETVGDRRDDVGDSEGTKVAGAKLGAGVFHKG